MIASTVVVAMYLKYNAKAASSSDEGAPANVTDTIQVTESEVADLLPMATTVNGLDGIMDDEEGLDNRKPKVLSSWRCNSNEFIVKIDVSPLHYSAAKRMLEKNTTKAAGTTTTTTPLQSHEEDDDEEEEHHSDWRQFWNKVTHAIRQQHDTVETA